MAKTRTFIAVAPSREMQARAVAAIETLRDMKLDVKWVAEENIHWTLQFLGDLDDEELVKVCRRIEGPIREMTPFGLWARGVSAFPSKARPRTLWLGADEGGESLCELQAQCSHSLRDMGFREDRRPYVPHLTLGRLARGRANSGSLAGPLSELADFDGQSMIVDEVLVQASYLDRSGPTYQVLARIPLMGTCFSQ